MSTSTTPKPRAGSTGRKTRNVSTSPFGTPGPRKHAEGRATTKATPQYPKGSVALNAMKTRKASNVHGSPYDTALPNRQVNGPAVQEGGGTPKPAGSTGSPFRSKGGHGPGNSTKKAK